MCNRPLRAIDDGANSGVAHKPTGNSNGQAANTNFCAVTPSRESLADDNELIVTEISRCSTVQETCCELTVVSTDSTASARRATTAPNVAFALTSCGEHERDLSAVGR